MFSQPVLSLKKTFICLTVLVTLSACAAKSLNPAAQSVRIVTQEPSQCDYIGEVTGDQGNFFTGGWTSNANLETGARNDMKNQAAAMGANTILIIGTRAGNTGSWGQGSGHMEQTNVVYSGTAYRCAK